MPLFEHKTQQQPVLEKPAPVAQPQGDAAPRPSDATHVHPHGHGAQHQPHSTIFGGGNNPVVGDMSADGRAWIQQRPSVGAWFKQHWVDLRASSSAQCICTQLTAARRTVTMAAMGAIGLGVYEAPPAPTRSFPITFAVSRCFVPRD